MCELKKLSNKNGRKSYMLQVAALGNWEFEPRNVARWLVELFFFCMELRRTVVWRCPDTLAS